MVVRLQIEWLEHRARCTPERVAVVDAATGQRWTFEELHERACRLAYYYQEKGIKKGDRIALLSPNDIGYMDQFFACAKLGAIFVPLNWRLSLAELDYLIQDCVPACFIYHDSMEGLSKDLQVDHKMVLHGTEYKEIMQNGLAKVQKEPLDWEDPLTMIYTGGTTGKPKGVVLSHRSIVWNSLNTIISWGLTSEDVTATYLPMFHTGGLNALTIPVLHIGGTVVLARDFHPERAIELLQKESCTVVLMVPTMYHMMVQHPRFESAEFPAMHTFLSGGAPCPQPIYDAFERKGALFKEGYGLTEAGPNNFYMPPDQVRNKRGSVGKPMMYNQIRLITLDGRDAGDDEVGEIWIEGPHVFDQYWNLPEATQEALSEGWLHTGDLARRDADGFYYIVGRKKDMIITGGENVYPLEVEHLLEEYPGVDEVAVVGLPDDKWGEVVTAVLIPKPGVHLEEEALKAYCQEHLGRYKVPKFFFFLDELPKTPVGKIDKKEIVRKLKQSA
jgi:fatty-acyl-CoA synthase